MAGLKSLLKDTAIYGISSIVGRFLNKEGFLKRTPRGREVTELAYKHLGRSIFREQTLFD